MFNNIEISQIFRAGVKRGLTLRKHICGRIESEGPTAYPGETVSSTRRPEEIKAFPAMALLPWKSPKKTLHQRRPQQPAHPGGADFHRTMPAIGNPSNQHSDEKGDGSPDSSVGNGRRTPPPSPAWKSSQRPRAKWK